MRKLLVPLLVVAMIVAIGPLMARAASATAQPVAVLSWAGYNAWLGDVEVLGKVSGNPDLAKGLEAMLKLMTANRGLAGLDKDRPVGAILVPEGDNLVGFGYVPVTDLAELLAVFKSFNPGIAEEKQGVWRIPTKQGKTLYATQREGWAVLTDRAERLSDAPAAPAELLADLAKQYDLAVRVLVTELPSRIGEQFAQRVRSDTERDLQRRPGEDDVDYSVRKQVTEALRDAVLTVAADLEQVTVGWSLDGSSERMFLDVTASAKPGTETARQMARLEKTTTQFAGFRLPEAALTVNWAGKLSESEAAGVTAILDAVHTKALQQIDQKPQSADKKAAEKHLAESLLGMIGQMVRGQRVDGAMSVVLGPQTATILGAQCVADGSKLDEIVRFLADAAKKDNPEAANWIHLDAEQYEGVQLHTVTIPIPPDAKNRPQVVALVGETLEVVVGVGKENAYVAAGRNAMETLKRAIAASKKDLDAAVPPVAWSLSVGPVAEFVATAGKEKDRPKAAALASVLKSTADRQDHITLTAGPIERGVRVHLEAEAGLLKALGAMSAAGGRGVKP